MFSVMHAFTATWQTYSVPVSVGDALLQTQTTSETLWYRLMF